MLLFNIYVKLIDKFLWTVWDIRFVLNLTQIFQLCSDPHEQSLRHILGTGEGNDVLNLVTLKDDERVLVRVAR